MPALPSPNPADPLQGGQGVSDMPEGPRGMTPPHIIHELVTCLGHGVPHQFYTRESLTRQLQAQVASADALACQEAICQAVTMGVLGHVGSHYLVRRQVTAADTQQIVGASSSSALALTLSAQVQALKAVASAPRPCPPVHPWLILHPSRTPLSLRAALEAQAREILGGGVAPEDLERLMHVLAAKALLQAVTSEEAP